MYNIYIYTHSYVYIHILIKDCNLKISSVLSYLLPKSRKWICAKLNKDISLF